MRVLGTARGLCNNIVRLDYSAPTSAGADVYDDAKTDRYGGVTSEHVF